MEKNVIFIQFYHEQYDGGGNSNIWINNKYKKLDNLFLNREFLLSNGFSSCFNICKNIGDFVWIKYDLSGNFYDVVEKNKNLDLPISNGYAYVSAFYNVHLYQTYLWAIKYPKITFIVGGPAADIKKIKDKLPFNLTVTEKPLHEILDTHESWNIDIPKTMNGNILISYPIEEFCYWGKCNFCTYPTKPKYRDLNYNFIEPLVNKGVSRIFLYSPGISPVFLETKFHNFKTTKNIEYWTHLRLDKEILNVLKNAMQIAKKNNFDLTRLHTLTGVEFPSHRMLKWMNKGMEIETILEGIKILVNYGSKPAISLIFGWNNLIEKDIHESNSFFDKLYKITNGNIIIKFHRLAAKVNTHLYNTMKKEKDVALGPFNFGFVPELSKEQEKFNFDFRNHIMSKGFICIINQSDNFMSDFI